VAAILDLYIFTRKPLRFDDYYLTILEHIFSGILNVPHSSVQFSQLTNDKSKCYLPTVENKHNGKPGHGFWFTVHVIFLCCDYALFLP